MYVYVHENQWLCIENTEVVTNCRSFSGSCHDVICIYLCVYIYIYIYIEQGKKEIHYFIRVDAFRPLWAFSRPMC